MNKELEKDISLEYISQDEDEDEDDVIQKDIEDLDRQRAHVRKMRILEEKRDDIKEEIDSLEKRKKRVTFDNVSFVDVILFIIFVLLAGALLAEGRVMGRYAIIPLIVALIIAWKLIDKFA